MQNRMSRLMRWEKTILSRAQLKVE
jgi:hypothetical protein